LSIHAYKHLFKVPRLSIRTIFENVAFGG